MNTNSDLASFPSTSRLRRGAKRGVLLTLMCLVSGATLAACSSNRLDGATPMEAYEIVREVLCETNERCFPDEHDQASCLEAFDDTSNFSDPISDEDLEQLDVCLDALEETACDAVADIESAPECESVKRYLDLK